MPRSRPYKTGLNERLRNPDHVAAYLNAAAKESQDVFMLALRFRFCLSHRQSDKGLTELSEVGRIAILTDPQGAFISAYQPEGEGPAAQGVFVWDELGTTDADEAQRFYGEVFGWTTSNMGPEYGGYRIFNRGETGIAGFMTLPGASVPPHWQPYVAVDDPDATTAKAKELGGAALMEPMDVPKVGRLGVLRDPQGATFGIIRPDPAS